MTGTEETFKNTINSMYPNPTLTDREVASILSVHKETIYRMRKNGNGPPFIKTGKKVLYLKQDFFEWFFSNYSKNNKEALE